MVYKAGEGGCRRRHHCCRCRSRRSHYDSRQFQHYCCHHFHQYYQYPFPVHGRQPHRVPPPRGYCRPGLPHPPFHPNYWRHKIDVHPEAKGSCGQLLTSRWQVQYLVHTSCTAQSTGTPLSCTNNFSLSDSAALYFFRVLEMERKTSWEGQEMHSIDRRVRCMTVQIKERRKKRKERGKRRRGLCENKRTQA